MTVEKAKMYSTAIVDTHDSIFDKGTCVSVKFLRKLSGLLSFQCTRGNQTQCLTDIDLTDFVL